jgi:hypothetical protein
MTITVAKMYSSPSSQDPSALSGFGGPGSIWAHTDDGIWLARNSGNTGWNIVGSGDQAAFGLFPLSGGGTSGAVSGLNGIMTADGNTPFAVPPTITSKSSVMATMLDLYNLQQALNSLVSEAVGNALASIVVPGIRSNLAFGYFNFGGTQSPYNLNVPIVAGAGSANVAGFTLSYPDGTAVGTADCVAYAVQSSYPSPNGGAATETLFTVQSPVGMAWSSSIWVSTNPYAAGFTFMIIAMKQKA